MRVAMVRFFTKHVVPAAKAPAIVDGAFLGAICGYVIGGLGAALIAFVVMLIGNIVVEMLFRLALRRA